MIAILTLGLVSVIGFSVSILMLQQLRVSRQAGQSVVAFYAADAGAERCLYEVRQDGAVSCPHTDVSLDSVSDAVYTTTYDGANTITSVGHFEDASRKIEVTW